ncbi:MAG: alkaline phosphatase family protein [Anaerolineae bacterium]
MMEKADRPAAPRVLVIGLDGGEWRVLEPLVAQGRMPNLGRLLERGVRGHLASTVPPVTAPAWASFLTGANPGKHGVFAFQRPLDQGLDRGWVNGAAIRAPKLWHYLEGQGLRCAFINVPMSYPPEPLPGYMVTGMLTPLGAECFTYPADLSPALRARGYVTDLRIRKVEREIDTPEQQVRLLQDLQDVARRRVEGVLWLWEREPVDLLMVVFETPDRLQHFFWGRLERALAEGPADAVDEALLGCYGEVDRGIGALLALADEGTTVFVLSDHGFCGLHTAVHLDQWLAERGLLRYAGAKATVRRRVKAGLAPLLKRVLPRPWLLRGRQAFAVARVIDWERTRVYSGRSSENAVFLNTRGREPKGIVEPGQEYEALREEVIKELQALRDPRTGKRVLRRVFRREEVYHGPYVDSAPDVLFELTEGYEVTSEVATAGVFRDVSAQGAGFHAQEGIFVAAGAGVAGPGRVEGAHIQDLAPTILHCLGLPVPTYMDGRVLEEVFAPAIRAAHPVVFTEALPTGIPAREAGSVFSPEDEEEIRQRLAGLGYLS